MGVDVDVASTKTPASLIVVAYPVPNLAYTFIDVPLMVVLSGMTAERAVSVQRRVSNTVAGTELEPIAIC